MLKTTLAVVLVTLAMVGVWVVSRPRNAASPDLVPAAPPRKQYAKIVAEGVRYMNPAAGVRGQCLSFKSCRIEKRKSGWITLGAFNVLVIDDLAVTLPPTVRDVLADAPGGKIKTAVTVPDSERIQSRVRPDVLSYLETVRSFIPPNTRLSGVRIEGLKLSREEGGRACLLLTARRAETGLQGTHLKLLDCKWYREDRRPLSLPKASLVLTPQLSLTYENEKQLL